MDPYSIFVDGLPRHLTYGEIKAAFWSFQPSSSLQILKKEHYLIITFAKEEAVQRVLQEKDKIRLKGQRVNIIQATKRLTYHHHSFYLLKLSFHCRHHRHRFSFRHFLYRCRRHLHRHRLHHQHQPINTRSRRDFHIFIINSLVCFN